MSQISNAGSEAGSQRGIPYEPVQSQRKCPGIVRRHQYGIAAIGQRFREAADPCRNNWASPGHCGEQNAARIDSSIRQDDDRRSLEELRSPVGLDVSELKLDDIIHAKRCCQPREKPGIHVWFARNCGTAPCTILWR